MRKRVLSAQTNLYKSHTLSFSQANLPKFDVPFMDSDDLSHPYRFGRKFWETKQATKKHRNAVLLLARNNAINETIPSVTKTFVKEIVI